MRIICCLRNRRACEDETLLAHQTIQLKEILCLNGDYTFNLAIVSFILLQSYAFLH